MKTCVNCNSTLTPVKDHRSENNSSYMLSWRCSKCKHYQDSEIEKYFHTEHDTFQYTDEQRKEWLINGK